MPRAWWCCAAAALATATGGQPNAWRYPFGGSQTTGWVGEDTMGHDQVVVTPQGELELRGAGRIYLVHDYRGEQWDDMYAAPAPPGLTLTACPNRARPVRAGRTCASTCAGRRCGSPST